MNALVGVRNPGDSRVLESKFAVRLRPEQPPIVVLARSVVVANSERSTLQRFRRRIDGHKRIFPSSWVRSTLGESCGTVGC